MEGASQPPSTGDGPDGLPLKLHVAPWRDELVENLGFGPRSMYVEMCWLPVLGPTATWLYRRLGSWAAHNAEGVTLDTVDLAMSIGLGEGTNRNSLVGRAIWRLVRFDAARWAGEELQVRTALAPLPERHVKRLGATSLRLHEAYLREPASKRGRNV